MTEPTKPIDELQIAKFCNKWATYFAKHGTGYFEHYEKDTEFMAEVKKLIIADRKQLLDRVEKEVICEDEAVKSQHYYVGDIEVRTAFPDNRNKLRTKQRTALVKLRKELGL